MPANDREVFEYFRADPDTAIEVDHLAYASYAYDKYDWMDLFEQKNQRQPTLDEENFWISQLPNGRLDEIHDAAYEAFRYAAQRYMNESIEQEKKRAIDHSILDEIKRYTSFWRNLAPNLLIAVAGSVAFSILLILMASIFAHDPSPIALYKAIVPPSSH